MKINHEIVRSVGVILSLIFSSVSLYFSVLDRLSQNELLTVTLAPEPLQYRTVLYVADGRLHMDARYNLTVSNASSANVSIVALNGVFQTRFNGEAEESSGSQRANANQC